MSADPLQTAYCHMCRGEVVPDAARCPLCGVELLDVELDQLPELREYVRTGPLLAWSDEERKRLVEAARARGEQVHGNDRGLKRLLEVIGLKPELWQHVRSRKVVPVTEAKLYLDRAGACFEDVYGPEDRVGSWVRRTSPRTRVKLMRVTPDPTPGDEGWVPEDRPADAYKKTRPVPRRSTGRGEYLSAEQLRFAAEAYLVIPTLRFAAQEVERRYGLCGYTDPRGVYQGVQKAFRRRGWIRDQAKIARDLQAHRVEAVKRVPRSRSRVPEWLVYEAAYRYYWDQWGFPRMGRYFHPLCRTLYRKPSGLEAALYYEFKRRGWPRRDRIEATRIASFKHGLASRDRYKRPREEAEGPYRAWLRHRKGVARPRCTGIVTQGQRTGLRCMRAAAFGTDYCPQHDPAKRAHIVEQVTKMQRRSHGDEVPVEPFAVWLEHERESWPTTKAMCQAVAARGYGKVSSLQAFVASVVKRERPNVRRASVEKFLRGLAGSGNVHDREVREETVVQLAGALGRQGAEHVAALLGDESMTFEDLYGPYLRGER